MKASELRERRSTSCRTGSASCAEQLFDLRLQKATGQLENPARMRAGAPRHGAGDDRAAREARIKAGSRRWQTRRRLRTTEHQPRQPRKTRRQVKVGRVVTNKMDKTVVVAVESSITHRLYQRYMKRTSKFHAHDEENQCNVGDPWRSSSSRPLSKRKRWRVREIVEAGPEGGAVRP